MANVVPTPRKDRAEATVPETTRGGLYFTPRVDIVETDKELTLFADLPGVRPEDVDLHYENGELVVHGKVQPRRGNETMLLKEYDEGDFYRVFTIHESIDAQKIAAECKKGVLTVHLPKVEAAQPRRINIKAG
jgi:HSP20 family protein